MKLYLRIASDSLGDVCNKLEIIVNRHFEDIPDINIYAKPNDESWYIPDCAIMIDIDRFQTLESESKLLTIAHEVAHHIVENDFNDYFRNKYHNNMNMVRSYSKSNTESLADFIVKYEFELENIGSLRDQERIASIEFLKKSIEGNVTDTDMRDRANFLC